MKSTWYGMVSRLTRSDRKTKAPVSSPTHSTRCPA